MHAETLYTINGGELISLTPGPVIPRGLGTAIAFNLDSFVQDPGLAIGSWDQTVHDDRPAAMSFTSDGTIVSVIISEMDGDGVGVGDRIAAIHSWLSPMQLRDLSQLFTEPAAFYEGLWDMSPNATIALQNVRRYVVVTATRDTTESEAIASELGNAHIEFVHLDVFTSEHGDDPIIRWSPDKGQPLTSPTSAPDESTTALQMNSIVGSKGAAAPRVDAGMPDKPSADRDAEPTEIEIDGTNALVEESEPLPPPPDAESVIDLSDAHVARDKAKPGPSPRRAPPASTEIRAPSGFQPGQTYPIETLPQLFDPNDDLLESISDEMFAVPGHLVLVDKLPERRRQPSPFENPGRYRWDANTALQTMLEDNLSDRSGARLLHLFVESDRQVGLATYVGLLATATDNKAGRYSTSMWFDIEPKVNAPLWQLFRKGRLPELGDGETADLSATQS